MRLIDADAFREELLRKGFYPVIVAKTLERQPTIEAVPVVHGYNITEMNPVDEFICSECGCICEDVSRYEYDEECDDWHCYEFEFRFCPNCGADMRTK